MTEADGDKRAQTMPWALRLVRKWVWSIGLLPLVIDFIVAYIPKDDIPGFVLEFLASGAKWNATILLLAAGLIGSAYLIHREDLAELAELQLQRANIHLVATDVVFLHSEPVLTMEGRFEDGLRSSGIPIEATITASLEVHNRGREEGELDWHLDLARSDCPDVFVLLKGSEQGEMHSLQPTIPGRSRHQVTWRLELAVPDGDGPSFARRLTAQRRCTFVLRYRTLRVGTPSQFKDLPLEGLLDNYISTLADRWRSAGLEQLAVAASQPMTA